MRKKQRVIPTIFFFLAVSYALNFTYSPSDPRFGEQITFTATWNTSEYNFTKFWWDFGDGDVTYTTTNQTTHSYSVGGIYTVNLTAYDTISASNSSYATDVYVFEPTIYIYANDTRTGSLIENFTVRVWNESETTEFNSTGTAANWSYHEGPTGNVSLLIIKDYYNSTVETLYISNSSDVNYTASVYPAAIILAVNDYEYPTITVPWSATIINETSKLSKSASWEKTSEFLDYGIDYDAVEETLFSKQGQLFRYSVDLIDSDSTNEWVNYSAYLCDENKDNCIELDSFSTTPSGTGSYSTERYIYVSKSGSYKVLNTTGNIESTGSFAYFPATLKIIAGGLISGYYYPTPHIAVRIWEPEKYIVWYYPNYTLGQSTIEVAQETGGFFGYLENTYAHQILSYNPTPYSLINCSAYMIPDNEDISETIYVLSSSNAPIEGAYVAALKYIDGEYRTVSSAYTDGVGKAVLTLKNGDTYSIVITSSGYETYTTSLVATGENVYFNLVPSVESWSSPFSGVAVSIEPDEVYAGENNTFKLTVSDPSGLLQSYWLQIIKDYNETIYSQSGSSSTGGILEYTVQVGTDETGFYKVVYGFTRYNGTAYTFNTSKLYPVIVHGMMEQAEDLMNSNEFGDFGKAFISLAIITVAFSHGAYVGLITTIVLYLLGAITKGMAWVMVISGVAAMFMGAGI